MKFISSQPLLVVVRGRRGESSPLLYHFLDPLPNHPCQFQPGSVQGMVAGKDHFFVVSGTGQGFQFLPQRFHHPFRRGHCIPAASDQQQVPILEPMGVLDEAPLPGMLDAVLPQVFEPSHMEHGSRL